MINVAGWSQPPRPPTPARLGGFTPGFTHAKKQQVLSRGCPPAQRGVQTPLNSLRAPEPRQGWWRHFGCTFRWVLSCQLRGKRQSSRRKRTYWKEMLQNSCSNLIPSAATEKNLLRVARHKLRMGAATLIQIYTTLLTALVDSFRDKTTHPDWNYPLQFRAAEVECEKQDWMILKRGGEGCYPTSNIQYHSLCVYLQPFCCVN